MKFGLDHVVIAVTDLSRTVDDYRELGFTVQRGGRHPGRTSHNALVVFEDRSYLELISWPEPGQAERWYNELQKHGEGLMDFALIPEDVPRAIAEAKSRGLHLNGPFDGGRVRPDGRELQWQTARQTTFDLPFLCGDITPREWRVPMGEGIRHSNGAKGIVRVDVAVNDFLASVQRYRALLGVDVGASFEIGGTTITLLDPTNPIAARRLAARGEGPCAIAVRTARTHGVALEMTGFPPQPAPE